MRVWYGNTIYWSFVAVISACIMFRTWTKAGVSSTISSGWGSFLTLLSLLLFTSVLLLLPACTHLNIKHLFYEGPCCSVMTWLFVCPGLFMRVRKEILRNLMFFKVTVTVLKQVQFIWLGFSCWNFNRLKQHLQLLLLIYYRSSLHDSNSSELNSNWLLLHCI